MPDIHRMNVPATVLFDLISGKNFKFATLKPIDRVLFCCEGVDLFICAKSKGVFKIDKIHCDSSVHGVHPRVGDSEAYRRIVGHLKPKAAVCERCDGGWIDVDSVDGKQLTKMALAMRMLRGVRLSEDGYQIEQLQPEDARATIVSILSGEHPLRATAGRAGSNQPGNFIPQNKED
jgi:hypothetical protein